MSVSGPWARRLSWAGFGLEGIGRIGLASWTGLSAGWLALAFPRGSGGWCSVLIATSAVALALPSLAVLLLGRLLGRLPGRLQGREPGRLPVPREDWQAPPVARRFAWAVASACFCAAAVWAWIEGWPR